MRNDLISLGRLGVLVFYSFVPESQAVGGCTAPDSPVDVLAPIVLTFSRSSCSFDSVFFSSSVGFAGMFGTVANWE